jgi:hypothetical protein
MPKQTLHGEWPIAPGRVLVYDGYTSEYTTPSGTYAELVIHTVVVVVDGVTVGAVLHNSPRRFCDMTEARMSFTQ